MEERIPPRPREARGPTVVAEPASAGAGATPCDDDDDDALAPVVVQLLSSSSDDEGDLEFEFEFPFVSRDSPAGTAAPADELFADGRIRTLYPVFGFGCSSRAAPPPDAPAVRPRVRGQLGKLFLEETRERNSSTSSSTSSSSSSSSGAATDGDGGLEGAAPESYCVWRPGLPASASASAPPTPPRKSGSTGSMARWRRISDLVVGRSHSDGREKFLFLAAAAAAAPRAQHDAPRKKKPAPASSSPAGTRKPPPPVAAAPATTEAAHRIPYLGVPVPPPGGTPRRTFLPYREELVGFFASVNGISRSHHHPF